MFRAARPPANGAPGFACLDSCTGSCTESVHEEDDARTSSAKERPAG